jgi:hypothetical protein
MWRLAVVGALVAGIAGCARLGVPNEPLVTTSQGRRCVFECKAIRDHCVAKVDRASGEDYLRFANPRLGACNDHLGDCYATCPD